ncbi:uncharacterized protein LOC135809583 isoform X4 [Sycon ciliatum]|uniref:uncharacterized protein LOC135809583 isoform X4 n=1 Tax=Sycon ciliatum TaxID=27933 RepID=UPI0031F62152
MIRKVATEPLSAVEASSRHPWGPQPKIYIPASLVAVVLLVSSAAITTATALGRSDIKQVTIPERQGKELRCKKWDDVYRGDFHDAYRWVHIPTASAAAAAAAAAAATNIGSGNGLLENSTQSSASSCDTSSVAMFGSTQAEVRHDLPAPGVDTSSHRVLVAGKILWVSQEQGQTEYTTIGHTRYLSISAALPQDSGLWVCCTTADAQPLSVFNVTVKGSWNKRPISDDEDMLQGSSGMGTTANRAVLSSKKCPQMDAVKRHTNCELQNWDCNCAVECSLSCEHSADDYFFTWTFSDTVLNVTNRVDLVGHGYFANRNYLWPTLKDSNLISPSTPMGWSAGSRQSLRYSHAPTHSGSHGHVGGMLPPPACYAHTYSSAEAQATLQSWNANRTHLTPFRFLSPADLEHWSIPRCDVTFGSRIGKGAFGQVYAGHYHATSTGSQRVALKMPKDGMFDSSECLQDMISEARIMFQVCQGRSPYLVNLIGVCVDNEGPPIILLEHCVKGSLIDWLRAYSSAYGSPGNLLLTQLKTQPSTIQAEECAYFNHKMQPSPTKVTTGNNLTNVPGAKHDPLGVDVQQSSFNRTKVKDMSINSEVEADYANLQQDSRVQSLVTLFISFSHQIAAGMEYLSRYSVVHRDLAARNILLTESNTLKIADFGLARELTTFQGYYRHQNHNALPYMWMAPETLPVAENHGSMIFNELTDVWSYGVVLWEIATLGEVPYGRNTPLHTLYMSLKAGHRLKDPGTCKEMRKMMVNCWHDDPSERPTFTRLRQYFASKLEKREDWEYMRLLDDSSFGTVDVVPEGTGEEESKLSYHEKEG